MNQELEKTITLPACNDARCGVRIKIAGRQGKPLSGKQAEEESKRFFNFILNNIPSSIFNKTADKIIEHREACK